MSYREQSYSSYSITYNTPPIYNITVTAYSITHLYTFILFSVTYIYTLTIYRCSSIDSQLPHLLSLSDLHPDVPLMLRYKILSPQQTIPTL